MMLPGPGFLLGDLSLYLCAAYIVGLALIAIEVILLEVRERTILAHLGWTSADAPATIDKEPRTGDAGDSSRP